MMLDDSNSNSSLNQHHKSLCLGSNNVQLACFIIILLITPLFVFVLIMGYRQWKKQRSFRSSSHIDVFTYNVVLMDLLGTTGFSLMFFSRITNDLISSNAGRNVFGIVTTGHTLFHLCTCFERYLAVVHPIFYLHLRGTRGVRIRNITIGCIWLTSIALITTTTYYNIPFASASFVLLSFTSVAFFFCSLSVLCALTHPGPGMQGVNREGTKQSKQRAFYVMIIITGTLGLRFLNSLISSTVQIVSVPYGYVYCVSGWSSVFLLLPSSLLLPLLFLQRQHTCRKLQVFGDKADNLA